MHAFAFRPTRTPLRAFARTRTRACRSGAFSPREGKDCGADRGRLHPTLYCRFEYLAGFSRHSSRVFSCEAFPPFSRCVRPLAGGHDNVKSERLAEKNVRQKYVRGLCNSNGECGHSLELPDLSSSVPGSPPRNESDHTFRKAFLVIPPPRCRKDFITPATDLSPTELSLAKRILAAREHATRAFPHESRWAEDPSSEGPSDARLRLSHDE